MSETSIEKIFNLLNLNYPIRVTLEANGRYCGEVLQFPIKCYARTYETLEYRMRSARREYFENEIAAGREVPEPIKVAYEVPNGWPTHWKKDLDKRFPRGFARSDSLVPHPGLVSTVCTSV